MAAAQSAALAAPAAPIANVATGTPAGICTIDSSESSPPSDFDCTGTPSTGRRVLAAVMPGRCAAPPAPAISTSRPRARAPGAYAQRGARARGAHDARLSGRCERVPQIGAGLRLLPLARCAHDDVHTRG